MLPFALSLGVIWGVLWALFLQHTEAGKFLVVRRTWITVVIGIGVDVLILLVVLPSDVVLTIFGVIVASSIGIISRSVYNEWRDEHETFEVLESLNGD